MNLRLTSLLALAHGAAAHAQDAAVDLAARAQGAEDGSAARGWTLALVAALVGLAALANAVAGRRGGPVDGLYLPCRFDAPNARDAAAHVTRLGPRSATVLVESPSAARGDAVRLVVPGVGDGDRALELAGHVALALPVDPGGARELVITLPRRGPTRDALRRALARVRE